MLKVVEFVIMSHCSENSEIPWFYLQSQLLRRQILSLSLYLLQRHLELPAIALIESLAPEPTRQGKTVEFQQTGC